ncbi:class V chitinase [Penicillium sp. IBT 35674x]|nr:class V chitinase [Penicillium sp. IBT 35674x]
MWSPTLWVLMLCYWLPVVMGSDSFSLVSKSSSLHAKASTSPEATATTWQTSPQLARNSSKALPALFQPYSPNTPVFKNQKLLEELSTNQKSSFHRRSNTDHGLLSKRDTLPTGTCAPGTPCVNGACCSTTGVCSYAPSSCAADVCISNCNATAPCGEYAVSGEGNCPLNVCCSQYGFCGTTSDFCGTGCQNGYGSCGAVDAPTCSGSSAVNGRRIGYYESWANDPSSRLCDLRSPEDIELVGLTHLNFAFTFFDPSTFEISPMTSAAAELYNSFTGLKQKSQGLKTWISVGGWSFNDAGNSPDTQTAFSTMASSSANRRKFIAALHNFMESYGFDGVDIDWEYPAASDRGGTAADTDNFATLVAEMRSSWGTSYGISATLPSSYWYLQGFDVVKMAKSVDWFNFMSYDIHGVWDATDLYTGPYIRPHTNLTEIKEGLDLLWMAGVEPSQVNLGLGWYGRSFTLVDSSCSSPNGVCEFSGGGNPGSCTNSAGTLSIAEIKAIQAAETVVESYDSEAAVKWITWNSNQWVSFDDGVTMNQKMEAANDLCLGGIMIWSMDMDNTNGDAMSDLMGIGEANGVTAAQAANYKSQLENATLEASIASSCYWTLCGGTCNSTYFDVTEARGQVANVQQDSVCASGEYQTLCCAPQTTMGTCQWNGYRGVGLPCTPVCEDTDSVVVAQNSNSYGLDENGLTEDLTCTGGYQAYCCSGFVPSSKADTGDMFLYGQGIFSKRSLPGEEKNSGETDVAISSRGIAKSIGTTLTYFSCAAALASLIAEVPFTFGISLLGVAPELAVCAASGIAVSAVGFASKPSRPAQQAPAGQPAAKKPKTGSSPKVKVQIGQWPILKYAAGAPKGQCDCSVTYTCRYGLGWDEVCDNQRWAITMHLAQQNVFNPNARRPSRRQYRAWARNQRKAAYRTLVQLDRVPQDARCELDEFPMGDLWESGNQNPQACRLVNGPANGRQGGDYSNWKQAQWLPCSEYRVGTCGLPAPPATWEFGPLAGNRGLMIGTRFISAFGFDSQTANSLCFASYTYTDGNNNVQNTMVPDHGFRGLDSDPMFDPPMNWPRQQWKVDPAPFANAAQRPVSINSAAKLRRDFPITVAMNQSLHFEDYEEKPSKLTCNAVYEETPISFEEDGKLAYDDLQFEDMLGNEIDGRACDVIYDDEHDGPVQIIFNEDGSVQQILEAEYAEYTESPVTSSDASVPTTEAPSQAGPKNAIYPEKTSIRYDTVMSQVTAAPHSADFEHHLRHRHYGTFL